jgi:hypothetical protein
MLVGERILRRLISSYQRGSWRLRTLIPEIVISLHSSYQRSNHVSCLPDSRHRLGVVSHHLGKSFDDTDFQRGVLDASIISRNALSGSASW